MAKQSMKQRVAALECDKLGYDLKSGKVTRHITAFRNSTRGAEDHSILVAKKCRRCGTVVHEVIRPDNCSFSRVWELLDDIASTKREECWSY